MQFAERGINMVKLFFLFIFLFLGKTSFSQYIHYSDPGTPKYVNPGGSKRPDKITSPIVTAECPGLAASLPVLTNYVPPEFVSKMKGKFDNHVYSITTLKVAIDKFEYKIKVCVKGQFKILMMDEAGNIVSGL
jgi:hypothetical protein